MLISLIVPCYNEQNMLQLFYDTVYRVINSISDYDFEIIFVNDGSTDLTLEIIRSLANMDKRVKYISFSRNFGKESAIYAGFSVAQGELISIMDADLQDPPDLLPEMIKYIEEGYDSVATRRTERSGEPPLRSFFARIFYKIINKISKIDILDGARDYRLITKQMLNAILSMGEYNRFTKGIFGWVGFNTKWISYDNISRTNGKSSWSFWNLFKYAIDGIIAFSSAPLRIASYSGIFFSLAAFIYLLYIIIRTFAFGIEVPGYASTVVVILFIGGMQLLSVGILGEYMARIYMEVKRRPLYIIQESNIEMKNDAQIISLHNSLN